VARLGAILRAPALIAAGSLAVHEGRYLAGYGGHSHEAQAEQGHAYLVDAVIPTVWALVGLAFVALVVAFFRAMRDLDPAPRPVRFAPTWIGAALALQVIYTGQELLEGYLAHGHPPGVAGVLGHGGWTAYAIAVAIGALVALLLRGAAAAVRWAAARAPRRPLAAAPARRLTLPVAPDAVPLAPLARGDAGRAPPSFA
jgi:hypothetical protein